MDADWQEMVGKTIKSIKASEDSLIIRLENEPCYYYMSWGGELSKYEDDGEDD